MGPNRIRAADELGRALGGSPGIDGKRVRVVHEERSSAITYGPFRLKYNNSGVIEMTPQIRGDLDKIRRLADGDQFPFLTAFPRPVPTPDPPAPREWDLRNAKGVYTLQIGVFYNTPMFRERKQAAVEWVKDLRSRGHEAYFLHGKTQSNVTVGSFDESAVVEGEVRPEDRNERRILRDYAPEVHKLREIEEFKYNLLNGAVERVNGHPQISFLVPVPQEEPAADDEGVETWP